jgi:hypothetical protein
MRYAPQPGPVDVTDWRRITTMQQSSCGVAQNSCAIEPASEWTSAAPFSPTNVLSGLQHVANPMAFGQLSGDVLDGEARRRTP